MVKLTKVCKKIVVLFLTFVFCCCEMSGNRWEFQIRSECQFPDAFVIKNKSFFGPVRYNIWINGEIESGCTIYQNIHSGDDSPHITPVSTKLKSGKISYEGGGDMYEDYMTLIYVPDSIKEQNGKLSIIVEIH
jgi:hypothetical protein